MPLQTSLALLFHALASVASGLNAHGACLDLILPIEVDTDILTFNTVPFANTYESKGFLAKSIARNADPAAIVGPTTALKKTYHIAISYCEPLHQNSKTRTLQILSHGIGFDKSYWDFGNATYNYILAARTAGYATLSYDRLGVGQSDHPDPYLDVQTQTQLVILEKLTQLARNGDLSSSIPKPQKLVHVGHSYGSLLTNALVAAQPDLSDGLILTGFTHNTTWLPFFDLAISFHLAKENNPRRFSQLSTGYLTWGDKYDNQAAFLYQPFFDPAVLEVAEETKAPYALAELLSFTTVSLLAPEFRGPILMISGQFDLPFCGGYCTGVIDGPYSIAPMVFPGARCLKTYIQPNTAHGLNLHLNASAGYDIITSFLNENEL